MSPAGPACGPQRFAVCDTEAEALILLRRCGILSLQAGIGFRCSTTMAWESRGRGRYFYAKARVDGRVRSIYLGAGSVGEAAAATGELKSAVREKEHADHRTAVATLKAAAAYADGADVAGVLADAAMVAAGFHRHHYLWRRRRVKSNLQGEADHRCEEQVPRAEETAPPDAAALRKLIRGAYGWNRSASEVPLPTDEQELRNLVEKACRGDGSVMPQVRALLRRVPDEAILLFSGDPCIEELSSLLARYTNNPSQQAAVRTRLVALRAELEGPSATAIEKVLVEQVVRCWMQVQVADRVVSESPETAAGRRATLLREQDSAHRRLTAAVKTLASVRRLAIPVLRLHMPPAGAASTRVG